MNRSWTDTELDTSLRDLYEVTEVIEPDLAVRRADLLRLIDEQEASDSGIHVLQPRRNPLRLGRTSRWLAVAAVLVGGAMFIPTVITRDGQPVSSASAAEVLTKAADAITTSDPAVPDGSYRQVTSHAWTTTVTGRYAFLAETVITEWVPADPSDPSEPWLLRHVDTGNRQWIVGTAEDAANAGMAPPEASSDTTEYSGACGDFAGDAGGCDRTGSWQDPSPRFLEDLPRGTAELSARLAAAAPPDSGSAGMFNYALDTLRSGNVPSDLRAALYRVLGTLPGIVVTQDVVNLDGGAGTALGIQGPGIRQDAIIDPATGQFIGSRSVQTEQADGIAAGTTIGWTAVAIKIVTTLN